MQPGFVCLFLCVLDSIFMAQTPFFIPNIFPVDIVLIISIILLGKYMRNL